MQSSLDIKFKLTITVNNPRSHIFIQQDIESIKGVESVTPVLCHKKDGLHSLNIDYETELFDSSIWGLKITEYAKGSFKINIDMDVSFINEVHVKDNKLFATNNDEYIPFSLVVQRNCEAFENGLQLNLCDKHKQKTIEALTGIFDADFIDYETAVKGSTS